MNPGEQMSPTASSLVLVCGNESLIIIIILIKQLLQNLHHNFSVRFLITQQSLIAKFLSTFYWPFIETYNSEITPTILRDSVFGLTRWRKNKIITIISHHIYDSQGPYLIIWFFKHDCWPGRLFGTNFKEQIRSWRTLGYISSSGGCEPIDLAFAA